MKEYGKSTPVVVVGLLMLVIHRAGAQEVVVEAPSSPSLTVGFSYPTGGLGNEGVYLYNGYQLWAEQVNDRGGVNVQGQTYFIRLLAMDDNTDQDQTEQNYRTLESPCDYFLGPYGSSFSERAAAVAEELGIPMVLSNAASNAVYENGYENIVSVVTLASDYCPPAIRMYASEGARRFYVAHSSRGFAAEVAEGCIAAIAGDADFVLTGLESYDSTISLVQAEAVVEAAWLSASHVLLSIGLLDDGEPMVVAEALSSYTPYGFFMTSAPGNPDFIDNVGSRANYLVGPSQWAPQLEGYSDSFWGTSANYKTTYEARYNSNEDDFDEVSFIAASASAAGTVLHLALESASSTDSADVLASLKALDTEIFYGPVRFSGSGSNEAKEIVLTQVIDEVIQVVYPPEHESADLIYPLPAAAARATAAAVPFLTLLLHVLLR
mmetsp:Transcript_6950/g.19682  ORF Transcript_6950/g.19682 Transcript_6950/m.19682 type:complete len:436 (-) Transcript_6950:216-1523(-)|eukprot:CAMPEP_0119155272 /NCGR_PEP_ID=MMETSP1310-20130426/51663_1 /TAXON_ID=464262 /ORGANISM="Genus nov. species nov., Strain RCC2339" /LENGTH=435 /DNA_ID=CAMNT_0007147863 /DNA_START=82 /DNA_END=1389 /DNA_ORIENTATION=+